MRVFSEHLWLEKKRIFISGILVAGLLFLALPQLWRFVEQAWAQNVTGFRNGVSVSKKVGAGEDKLSGGLRKSNGFYAGVSLGYLMGEEGNLDTDFVFSDVQKISEISSLLEFNLLNFLNQSAGRSDALDIYLAELRNQQTAVRDRLDILPLQIRTLEASRTTLAAQETTFRNELNNAIEQKFPFEAEDTWRRLAAVRGRMGENTTQLNVLQRINEKYTLAATLLQNKVEFVTANRDALIKGVRVINIPDPQIRLILTREEWLNTIR